MRNGSSLTRRDMLFKGMALGTIAVMGPGSSAAMAAAFQQKELRHPTPPNELGPFYKKRSPQTSMLRSVADPGVPLSVSGKVFNTQGEALSDAVLEVWQTDHLGHYDLDGYRYRAKLVVDPAGAYSFESVMPGHYPDRVCQHIHYLVTAPSHKPLVTQLYFATDPVFEGDPDKNYNRDPVIHSRELVRPVMLVGDPKDIHAAVNFEVCLERA